MVRKYIKGKKVFENTLLVNDSMIGISGENKRAGEVRITARELRHLIGQKVKIKVYAIENRVVWDDG